MTLVTFAPTQSFPLVCVPGWMRIVRSWQSWSHACYSSSQTNQSRSRTHEIMLPKKPPQAKKIHVPVAGNDLLEKALENINNNVEVATLWKVINVNAIDRLGMSDHGPVHVQIVANIALRLTRILLKHGVEMSITSHFNLSEKHAELVVVLASLFHDLGMSI